MKINDLKLNVVFLNFANLNSTQTKSNFFANFAVKTNGETLRALIQHKLNIISLRTLR